MRDERTARDLGERTKHFALRIIRMYSALPHGEVARVLGRQVPRSGTSVGANYREAYRARSTAEFASKLGECLKELEETAYWLELIVESHCLKPAQVGELLAETNELTAILTSIVKRLRSKSSN